MFQKISFENRKEVFYSPPSTYKNSPYLRLSIDLSSQIGMSHPNNNTENEAN